MRRRPAYAAALVLNAACAGTVLAQEVTAWSELEAGFSRERLSTGFADWESRTLFGAHQFRPRHVAYAQLRETERFALRDTEIAAGLYYPLASWTMLLEASRSPQHRVLPSHSLFAELHRSFAAGWGASAGWRHSEFTRSSADVFVLGAERYWDSWRGAYTLYLGKPEGAGSAAAHRFQLDRYYSSRSSVGISATTGREVENLGPPAGLISSEVRGFALAGRHWFAPDWAASYELLSHEQGSLYRRKGLRLGVRHRF